MRSRGSAPVALLAVVVALTSSFGNCGSCFPSSDEFWESLASNGAAPTTTDVDVHEVTAAEGDNHGFGSGYIFAPPGATGTHGAIVLLPGNGGPRFGIASMYGLAEHFARNGFVVFALRPTEASGLFVPDMGLRTFVYEGVAAARYLKNDSVVSHLVDPDRVGYAGWSLGGNAAILASAQDPDTAATIALSPATYPNFDDLAAGLVATSPTLVVACALDTTVGPAPHVVWQALGLFNPHPRAFVKLPGLTTAHACSIRDDAAQTAAIRWARRYIDDDNIDACPPVARDFRTVLETRTRACD